MTLVVTTASTFGITVSGDRAVSRRVGDAPPTVTSQGTRKVFYCRQANIALACWGNADFAGNDYFEWLQNFTDSTVCANMSLSSASDRLAEGLNDVLGPVASSRHGWSSLRRGVHVSGYVDGVPCIYHVHTGSPQIGHRSLLTYRDYPDVHGGGMSAYRASLDGGTYAQLFNGFHELFAALGASIAPLRQRLEADFGVTIPAPTLRGQREYDCTMVRLAAGLLRAADRAPQVSLDLDSVSFDASGLKDIPELTTDLPPMRSTSASDVTASPSVPITQSRWDGGSHADTYCQLPIEKP